jgi:hypothetical protein
LRISVEPKQTIYSACSIEILKIKTQTEVIDNVTRVQHWMHSADYMERPELYVQTTHQRLPSQDSVVRKHLLLGLFFLVKLTSVIANMHSPCSSRQASDLADDKEVSFKSFVHVVRLVDCSLTLLYFGCSLLTAKLTKDTEERKRVRKKGVIKLITIISSPTTILAIQHQPDNLRSLYCYGLVSLIDKIKETNYSLLGYSFVLGE